MAQAKKKRKPVEVVLSEGQCRSVLALSLYLEWGLITFDVKAIRKLNRELTRMQPDGAGQAPPSGAIRRLRASMPKLDEGTLRLLGKVLRMIREGARAHHVFRQHLKTKPATHRSSVASTAADYYYEKRAHKGPSASDLSVLQEVRAIAPDFHHLDDASLRRVLRRHKPRAIADLLERAKRQARGIPRAFFPSDDAPTPRQVEELMEHLRRKTARGNQS